MYVVAWYRRTRGISIDSPDPQRCQILSRKYPLSKICAPAKVDQTSPKYQMTCYAQMPFIVANFIALGQTMYEKSVTKLFTPLSILMLQKDPH